MTVQPWEEKHSKELDEDIVSSGMRLVWAQEEVIALRKIAAEAKELRRMLCVAVGSQPYMDDGEASDSSMWPHIDFLREPVERIQQKLQERGRNALKKGA